MTDQPLGKRQPSEAPMFHTGDKLVINNTELNIRHIEWHSFVGEWAYYIEVNGDIDRFEQDSLLTALALDELPPGAFLG